MNIIPAIDIIDGKCVRLQQGDYTKQVVYSEDPLNLALQFQDYGLQYLHIVDLDGAKKGSITNLKVLESIAKATNLCIDFSGGIRSENDIQLSFDRGASKVTLGSVTVKKPDLVLEWKAKYGQEKIIIGADCNNGKLAIQGWSDTTTTEIIPFVKKYESLGFTQMMCTDISCDGMLAGPSTHLYKEILASSKIHLIASGGISSIADLEALRVLGCGGAIIGKAIYEGVIKLSELRNYVEKTNNTMS